MNLFRVGCPRWVPIRSPCAVQGQDDITFKRSRDIQVSFSAAQDQKSVTSTVANQFASDTQEKHNYKVSEE